MGFSRLRIGLLCRVAVAFVMPVLAMSAPDGTRLLSIAEVRHDGDGDHLPDLLGQAVTTMGIVTVGADVFHTKRLQTFMQDETGGIQLFSNYSDMDICEGDLVEVSGLVGNHRGQTQLQVESYRLLQRNATLPVPIRLSLGSVSSGELEQREGMLAVVRGRVTGKRRNQGGEFLLLEEDRVMDAAEQHSIILFIHNTRATGVSLEPYSVGDEIEVRGIVSQYDYGPPYDEDYEILPSRASDIRVKGLTRRAYRRLILVGGPVCFLVVAWLVGLRIQIGVHTRRRIEVERRLSEERKQQAVTLRSIAEGVIATDTEGIVTVMNKRAEVLTGWSSNVAEGRSVAEVFPVREPSSGRESVDILHDVLHANAVMTLPSDSELVSRGGDHRQIMCRAAPVLASEGVSSGVVFVFDDCSERMRIESELQKASRLESIGLLAGGIAHDFNNILTVISGSLSLVRLGLSEGSGRECEQILKEAEKAAIDAGALTNQLLTFARGGAPVKKPMRLGTLVRDAASFALRGSTVKSEVAVDEELWPVEADAGQMRQVVQNVVLNGQESMPQGGLINITVSNVHLGPGEVAQPVPLGDGRYVRIRVEDHGCGISPEHIERVFDPYFTTKRKGSGLGLATSYAIVRNHGGHISASSEIDKGTVFDILVPATEETVSDSEEGGGGFAPGSGRILLMDDEPCVQAVASAVLRKAGYDVVVAEDGGAAIDAYAAAKREGKPFRVVILDLTVPDGMGGQEAIPLLRDIDPDFKAIVSSGYSTSPVMAKFRSFGFDGTVPKPYTAETLICAVQAVCGTPN